MRIRNLHHSYPMSQQTLSIQPINLLSLVPCFHQYHSSIVGCINPQKHSFMIRSFEEHALENLRFFIPFYLLHSSSLREQTPFATLSLTQWWTKAEIVVRSHRLELQLTQIRLKISSNSSYPLCILKESFAFFCSIKVFQVFLSVSQYCIHMCLVFYSKFKSPKEKPDFSSLHVNTISQS